MEVKNNWKRAGFIVLVVLLCCLVGQTLSRQIVCYNGGQCVYNQCICAPGFHGRHCEYGKLIFRKFKKI